MYAQVDKKKSGGGLIYINSKKMASKPLRSNELQLSIHTVAYLLQNNGRNERPDGANFTIVGSGEFRFPPCL